MIEIGKNNDLHIHYFFFLSLDPPPTELFKDFFGTAWVGVGCVLVLVLSDDEFCITFGIFSLTRSACFALLKVSKAWIIQILE